MYLKEALSIKLLVLVFLIINRKLFNVIYLAISNFMCVHTFTELKFCRFNRDIAAIFRYKIVEKYIIFSLMLIFIFNLIIFFYGVFFIHKMLQNLIKNKPAFILKMSYVFEIYKILKLQEPVINLEVEGKKSLIFHKNSINSPT